MNLLSTSDARVFISWVPHARRSEALAEAVGAAPVFVYPVGLHGFPLALVRYSLSTLETWWRLLKHRPAVVLCINQPVFLVLSCLAYARLTGARLALDHHAGAFNFKITAWARPLLRFVVRRSDLNVVASPDHEPILRKWGGDVLQIGAIPFEFGEVAPAELPDPSVTYVCTFSRDEPVNSVLDAARRLPDVQFFVTGDPGRADFDVRESTPENVEYTGFLPDGEYVDQLAGSEAVLCLTTRDSTLQRGAYEAMSLGRPIVTSDWPVLRAVFHRGAVFVENTPTSIAEGVMRALEHKTTLERQVYELLQETLEEWREKRAELVRRLSLAPRAHDREVHVESSG